MSLSVEKVETLVSSLAEFNPKYQRYGHYVYEVDEYRISISSDYNYGVRFGVYKVVPGKDLMVVGFGNLQEVLDVLPERFAQAMIFQLDLLT